MQSAKPGRRPNRLARATSPYLLQHAYNPVDWFPWGPEALQRAKDLNRPILLSIGYSACHWCHVMERESFEHETIADLMNRYFVCIKVDREERPDLDEIYMQATLALNQGQGGWPMTVFMTPDQQPFFAGTYFPPEDRWGRPGFPTVLKKIAEIWAKDPEGLRRQASEVTDRLRQELRPPSPISVDDSLLNEAAAQFKEDFDERFGGFGTAPKFPPATGLSLLLRIYQRSKDEDTLRMVTKTLDAMAAGGMYDHIGGGFARYSTDERWLVPHFEKMLYDNALLARTYCEAYQATQRESYRRIAGEVLDYVLREMRGPEGGFYSATDADSEGEEGKYFVWTPEEVRAAVETDEDARVLCAYFDITSAGNWEGKSIPNRMRPVETVANELGMAPSELDGRVARLRPLLYRARQQRVPPGLDDKIITAWNGMMIGAMAEGARTLHDDRYLEGATRAADFLLARHRGPDGRLFRTSRAGAAHVAGFLDDYACLTEGLIDLSEAGGGDRYLTEAVDVAQRLLNDFQDKIQGGFFTTAEHHETLIVRGREGADGATPSGNAVAAFALARLSFHFDRQDFRNAAVGAVRAYGRQMSRYPRAFAKSLAVIDLLTRGPVEFAFVGAPDDPRLRHLAAEVNRHFVPNRIVASRDPSKGTSSHPLLIGKEPVDGRPALYICRNFSCQQPLTDPSQVSDALAAADPAPLSGGGHPIRLLQGRAVPGFATVGGTAGYAVRTVNHRACSGETTHGFTAFGATGLTVSRLGFGTYRVGGQDAEQRAALTKALREGCNLIDTSTNYMDGDSERLVGSVLAELIQNGEIKRDEVIVVSKIGYVQGHNLKQAEARERAGNPYPEMVKYGEGMWHCIHPEFLAEQLTRSLDRLGLETLDVCLLHNPEYYLTEASQRGNKDLARVRDEFYERLRRAFSYFESQVAAGRLRYYGVSSNTVSAAPDETDATSLAAMLEAAQAAAVQAGVERARLAVIQCPMNLFESGAALTPNTGIGQRHTVLSLAREHGVAVLVNRPLNAMPDRRIGMLRLAELAPEPQQVDFERQREAVAKLEEDYRKTIAPTVHHAGQGMAPAEFFNWAQELARIAPQIQGLEQWDQIESQMIAPHVNQVLKAVSRHAAGPAAEAWEGWRERYVPELLALLGELRRQATERSRCRTRALASAIAPHLPDIRRKESLSRQALWVLTSTPGVTSVLNGMRSQAYVDDSMGILSWKPLQDPETVYRTVKTLAFPEIVG